jgi:Fe-S-cluster containining protein
MDVCPGIKEIMNDKNEHVTINDLERALRFNHLLITINRHMSREGASYAQALVGLLLEKGLISNDEFETRVQAHRQQMKGEPQVMLSKTPDKYTCQDEVIIDCASRIHLCRATCCTFRFFLSPQDLDEGIVKWDYGNPYWVRQRDKKYCWHCKPDSLTCNIHANRPFTCRVYDCRKDKRIWIDFDRMIPNPDLQDGENGKGVSIP